ncbi:hypothetical protein ACFLVK_01815 [Chloroflexota bacterium]
MGFGVTAASTIGIASGKTDWYRITIFLIAFIAVYLVSGLYIGALSTKIFTIAAFSERYVDDAKNWELVNAKYRKECGIRFIDLETTTLGVIYTILAVIISLFFSYVVFDAVGSLQIKEDMKLLFSVLSGILAFAALFCSLYYLVCHRLLHILSFKNEIMPRRIKALEELLLKTNQSDTNAEN